MVCTKKGPFKAVDLQVCNFSFSGCHLTRYSKIQWMSLLLNLPPSWSQSALPHSAKKKKTQKTPSPSHPLHLVTGANGCLESTGKWSQLLVAPTSQHTPECHIFTTARACLGSAKAPIEFGGLYHCIYSPHLFH